MARQQADTVTTSTTEAELLALSQAAKESLYISRLLQELEIQREDERIRTQCDNQQTIRLVASEIATLQTRLRHETSIITGCGKKCRRSVLR
jgi:hypothetical protein